jgi:hypothetical protein
VERDELELRNAEELSDVRLCEPRLVVQPVFRFPISIKVVHV